MNRIKLFSLIFISAFLIVSCSKSSQLEKAALKQMEETMKEIAKDPSSVQLTNIKTVYSCDSICIIHYDFAAKNGFGGVSSEKMEYIYLLKADSKEETDKDGKTITVKGERMPYEFFINLDDDNAKSVLEIAREEYQKKIWKEGSPMDKMTEDEKKAFLIYNHALLSGIFRGRYVNQKTKSEDVDNW